MGLLAADINDAGITVLGDDAVLYREAGFALLEDDGLHTGNEALANARVKPRRIHDHFWSNLITDPLPDTRFRHLSAADLVSRQLEEIRDKIGGHNDRIVVAVPAYMNNDNLGLFLGVCSEVGLPVIALIDGAVAATRRQYLNASPVHIDMSLHSTMLTRIAQEAGRAQLEKSAVVEGCGMIVLYESWIRCIADAFIQQSRFDPLHTAETEQMLLDSLPRWLGEAAAHDKIELELEYQGVAHTAEIESLLLVSAAAPVYQRIVSQLRALYRADETPAIQLTERAAQMPGLADMLKARVGGEVFLLEPGATARGLLNRCRDMQPGGPVTLIRQLPWDQAPVELQLRATTSERGRPTHLLFDNTAYTIDSRALNLGTQAVNGERWIDLRQSMPGVSRRHCSLQLESGQCVVRDYSRYGTFLNGHRLDGSAVLQVGDLLRLGSPGYELRLIETESAEQGDGT